MRQHRALRPAGGAAGVEQPRQRRRVGGRRHRRADGESARGVGAGSRTSTGAAVRDARAASRSPRTRTPRGTGVVEDLRHLARMQLVVDRDDDALGGPGREHQLDDLGAVVGRDRDPRARTVLLPDRAARRKRPVAQLSPRAHPAIAVIHRAAIGKPARGLIEQRKQIHRSIHCEANAEVGQILRRTPAAVDDDRLRR